MNWIAEKFQELKARVEAHIPQVNKSLSDLSTRVSGVESFTQQAVTSVEQRVSQIELRANELSELGERVKALELLAEQLQKAGAP